MAVCVRADATSLTIPRNPFIASGTFADLFAETANSPSSLRPQEYTKSVPLVSP